MWYFILLFANIHSSMTEAWMKISTKNFYTDRLYNFNMDILTSLHLFVVLGHVVRSYWPQEPNIVIGVEFCHLVSSSFVWSLLEKYHNLILLFIYLDNIMGIYIFFLFIIEF